MDQCPLAFVDPCSESTQIWEKLNVLESELQDLKKMLQQLVDKK